MTCGSQSINRSCRGRGMHTLHRKPRNILTALKTQNFSDFLCSWSLSADVGLWSVGLWQPPLPQRHQEHWQLCYFSLLPCSLPGWQIFCIILKWITCTHNSKHVCCTCFRYILSRQFKTWPTPRFSDSWICVTSSYPNFLHLMIVRIVREMLKVYGAKKEIINLSTLR